ncbi:DUF4097 family beta strand repeat protein [Paraneptunicella aestuarii]|uniref:DUF4097 family beta strand repeat-containing protein n=1 Tax=Paraneptunicella aestuarii TaxID=2831148 RepID=UPI001E3EA36F|nr:DUF4097 family beta strand repeat-containing protein [Paraneptunicella aestuarii]UAA38242.1 DUF4097 family beta strand repeat protein [Paraneptunicella aestuarii]
MNRMNNSIFPSFFFLSALSMFSFSALSGEKVDATLEAKAGDFIEIEHLNGKAKITGWDKELIQVKGELDDNAEEFVFRRTDSGIEIKVEMPRNNRQSRNGGGDDLEIFVPRNGPVSYTSVNANVTLDKLHSGVGVETVNGKINLSDAQGKIRIESVNGDVSSKQLNGDVRIETVNGSIDDKQSEAREAHFSAVNGHIASDIKSKEVSVETVNGHIDLKLDRIDRLEISTVNGQVEAQFAPVKDADIEVSSVGGKIQLAVPRDVSARFKVEAHAGGRIVNEITKDEQQRDRYGPGRWLNFTTGEGEAEVSVSTVSGKVLLKKID